MAEKQKVITSSTRQILSTLALLPAIQDMNIKASSEILSTVLQRNPSYHNIALVDLNGDVMAAGRAFSRVNLADRKHVKDAITNKTFAVGEFIVTRVGAKVPTFPFAYPVLDKEGRPKAVLAAVIKLASSSSFYNLSELPEKSFVAVTDHQGIRLFYYPVQSKTNPIGKPIKTRIWDFVKKSQEPGILISTGSDGLHRIFAFEQIHLSSEEPPYLYVWAGVPEEYILAPANSELRRNLLFLLLATVIALFLSWPIGRYTILVPIQGLVSLTSKFAQGDFSARYEKQTSTNEFGMLINAFHEMADALSVSEKTIHESEVRFRRLLDSLDVLVYVSDMASFEVIFINTYGKNLLGDVTGKICWQSIQKDQTGPCDFCTNKYLLDKDGKPGEVYTWEFKNTVNGKWFHIIDRAITWSDGRLVRLEMATDISSRKENELIKEALIEKLEKSIAEIKTLRGILPICSFCKNIRNDQGYYEQIESYIHKHSDVDFSHTICPPCLEKHYPNEFEAMQKNQE